MSRPIVVVVCMDRAPLNSGSLNSAHIRGTRVPSGGAVHSINSGSGPAVRDTIAGHVDLTFTAGGMTYADQAKVLGVTSAKRTSAAPQVPAIAETVPGYEA